MGRNDEKNEIALRMKSMVPNRRREDALALSGMSISHVDMNDEMHLRDYLEILVRRKWIIIIFLISCLKSPIGTLIACDISEMKKHGLPPRRLKIGFDQNIAFLR